MKTPEQIAAEWAHRVYRPEPLNVSDIGQAIAEAIKADRAQEFDTARAIANEEYDGYSGHIAHMRWADFEQSLRTVASRAFRAGRIAEQLEAIPAKRDDRSITIALDTGEWLSDTKITGDEGARIASAVLPGTTADQVAAWYGEWMGKDL
ncbi:MAG: hypothetical protein K0S37_788 [Microbacterium sp.]|nr:hypothetical protein [Microbacterium sp.]